MFAAVVPPGYIPPPPGPAKVERRSSVFRAFSEVGAIFAELDFKKKGKQGKLNLFTTLEQETESLFEIEKQKRAYYNETWKLLEHISTVFETDCLKEAVSDLISGVLDHIKRWSDKFAGDKLYTGLAGFSKVKKKIHCLQNFLEQCMVKSILPGDINQALQNLQVSINEIYRGFILEIPDYNLTYLFN
eukprot:TRINITY_DN1443_c0_g1_i1.p2 TRINITY_DN1443_c0_g1~~TRINITY_DN1443_c0_g1_i1.p2  ORF type:complete len:216 (-),score=14.74 TRINITY_DN1443_c0_g1_i1:642-1205(-)